MLVPDLLRRTAAAHPDREAVVDAGGILTYRQLEHAAGQLARALTAHGVRPGDRVAVMLPSCRQYALIYFGIMAAGGVIVPINPIYRAPEVQHQLADASVAAMITAAALRPLVDSLRRELPTLQTVWNLDGAGEDTLAWVMQPEAPGLPAPELDPSAPAACLYTSGTEGRPKGAVLTHRNLVALLESMGRVLTLRPEDRYLCTLPLFHSFAEAVLLLLPAGTGGRVTIRDRFVPTEVLELIASERITLLAAVPSMYRALLMTIERGAPYDFGSLEFAVSGGAALGVDLYERFRSATGVSIVEGYGPTECSPVVSVNPPRGGGKPGTVGLALPGVEVQIWSDAGEPLGPGQVGEIVVRGDTVMPAYWNRPEETRLAIRDGHFLTGDLGMLDADGYLTIVDRKKDLILVGGLNVYPSEVEQVLGSHPDVQEVVVVDAPDPVKGESVHAFVVRRPASNVDARALGAFARERLAAYKRPRAFTFVEALPRNESGKVLRVKLREEVRHG